MVLNVRYFAGAKAATGIGDEDFPLHPESTVDDALRMITERHGSAVARVLPACSLLLDGIAVHDKGIRLASGQQLDVLPPFAGG
ncbi:MoaD/ThiS family protein [Kutzneria viridogrisea]|uniref:Uncharacterized protein n=2 Tax=Kutzneria TaxID=43356 RepID=W5VZC3_9PSEU|nr:MoaD/ThiS family protein [Kutzneria albida]AHH93932.1 hypothetical protein KALB_556 [Kutzneria albida DSM 43870]MBA8931063.1 molybdopterin converting factor small subunit [Kutzneria viridogrisea]